MLVNDEKLSGATVYFFKNVIFEQAFPAQINIYVQNLLSKRCSNGLGFLISSIIFFCTLHHMTKFFNLDLRTFFAALAAS